MENIPNETRSEDGTGTFLVFWTLFNETQNLDVADTSNTSWTNSSVGNLLVILVILLYSSRSSLPNIYIINLAIADFLFMLTIPFLAYLYIEQNWVFGRVICKLVMSVDGMNQFAGVLFLTAMSFDRYLAIVRPISSLKVRSVRKTRLLCTAVWGFSVVLCLPLWMYTDVVLSHNERQNTCGIFWPQTLRKTFVVYAFAVGYILPLLVISTCYFAILAQVSKKALPGMGNKRQRSSRRVAVLVIVAVIVFAICWLPFYAIQLYIEFFLEAAMPSMTATIVYYVSICLSYSNSALNPFVYTFVGKMYRENIKRLLRCKIKTNGSAPGSSQISCQTAISSDTRL
ncbi:somatostatin receptor type 5-like [Saccoglossus kowalevskii]|uniref:Somatostatin receptor type 2-like n=1 Tax=Saccoglossus kowalevskii TaxID=10224 RepID=A0ABM0M331_SACKO|nr:PREDICTED: somatostatin receptor type 2-like [Saccoglossus kowalevskii]